jgi:two-component system phosphate regulon response regulator PhoB
METKPASTEKPTVLVVEDEHHIRRVLDYNLSLAGFDVLLAEDGAAGLSLARRERPDVILLDWAMPVMNGLQVLKELKNDEATADIAIFMLTAKGLMSDVEEALKMGADDYITKPFQPAGLADTIRQKLQKHRRERTAEEVTSCTDKEK